MLATPPLDTYRAPPEFNVVVLAAPPENTYRRPPEFNVVALAVPPLDTCRLPPEFTVVALAVPSDKTLIIPPEFTVVFRATPPEYTSIVSAPENEIVLSDMTLPEDIVTPLLSTRTGIRSMLATVWEDTSEMLPTASMPRKYTVPFSVITTPPVYSRHVWLSRLYCFVTVPLPKNAATVTLS